MKTRGKLYFMYLQYVLYVFIFYFLEPALPLFAPPSAALPWESCHTAAGKRIRPPGRIRTFLLPDSVNEKDQDPQHWLTRTNRKGFEFIGGKQFWPPKILHFFGLLG